MNRALLVACFAMSAIALALSLVPRDPPVVPSAPTAGPTLEDLEQLDRRIDAVEDTSRDLLNRVAQQQRLGSMMALPLDAGVPAALQLEVAQLRDEVRGMVAGEALHSEGGKQFLKQMVRELQAEDARARNEQQLARTAERAEEQKAQWKKFVTDAHLNYAQEQAVMGALDAETAKRKAQAEEVRAGTKSFSDTVREGRDVRRETDQKAKATLDEAQQKQYDQLRREQRQIWRRTPQGDVRPE